MSDNFEEESQRREADLLSAKVIDTEPFDERFWDREPFNRGPNRGIRVGGAVNVAVFPIDPANSEIAVQKTLELKRKRGIVEFNHDDEAAD